MSPGDRHARVYAAWCAPPQCDPHCKEPTAGAVIAFASRWEGREHGLLWSPPLHDEVWRHLRPSHVDAQEAFGHVGPAGPAASGPSWRSSQSTHSTPVSSTYAETAAPTVGQNRCRPISSWMP